MPSELTRLLGMLLTAFFSDAMIRKFLYNTPDCFNRVITPRTKKYQSISDRSRNLPLSLLKNLAARLVGKLKSSRC
jgi:hypothetical protein